MRKLKVLSLFSGIGAFEKALTNIGVDYELVGFSEIDKYAIKSYCAIHNIDEHLNLGDITKIDVNLLPKDIDLITHGSPCQDYSIAGKGEGGDKDSNTRSSLMWNTVEIVRNCKPKYVIWENVKNVLSKKHKHNFDKYINSLNELGYKSYHKVLNSKDFKIPQNRERIFVISILGEHDVFEFPEGYELRVKLKDILETDVSEKYYINKSFEVIDKTKSNSNCSQIAKVDLNGHDYLKRVYDIEKCSPTLPTGTGGNHEPKILECIPCASRGRYDEKGNVVQHLELRKDHVSNCLTSVQTDALVKEDSIIDEYYDFRVRKLTPNEYWRLQAFSDEDFNKCVIIGISNSQLYKQAGNSITVTVLEEIFKILFRHENYIEE